MWLCYTHKKLSHTVKRCYNTVVRVNGLYLVHEFMFNEGYNMLCINKGPVLYLVFDNDITLAVTNIYLADFFSPGVEFYNKISLLFRVIML